MTHTVLLTGATGMIGRGILLECLDAPDIDRVKVLTRRSLGLAHPKLEEILLPDFLEVDPVAERLEGVDACFHAMGVSAVGLGEAEYTRLTHTVTLRLAKTLRERSPDAAFFYVSGTGTNHRGGRGPMWARVKGRTENDLLALGFRNALMFRPGFVIPERGLRSRTPWYDRVYRILRPAFPLLRRLESVTTTRRIGLAMLHALTHDHASVRLENAEINRLAKAYASG